MRMRFGSSEGQNSDMSRIMSGIGAGQRCFADGDEDVASKEMLDLVFERVSTSFLAPS